jgi:hypothetical protein
LHTEKVSPTLIGHIFVAGLQAIQAALANTDENKSNKANQLGPVCTEGKTGTVYSFQEERSERMITKPAVTDFQ